MKRFSPVVLSLPFLLLALPGPGGRVAAQQKEGGTSMPEAAQPPVVKDEGKILPVTAEIHKLPSGLTVALVPFDSPGLAAYYTAMRVGSRDEVEAGHSGFAHLFEHIMFRGTKNLPGPVYDNAVTAMGADSSAWTWNDQTVYFFVAPSDKLGKVIEMEAERFKNLAYGEPEFKTESGAVLGEYNKNYSDPTNKLEETLFDKAFTVHTYKHTTMGFIKDIKVMPTMYTYSLQFFKRHYVPGKAIIFVVGDFKNQHVLDLIEKHYGDWSAEPWPTKTPTEPAQAREIRVHLDWKNPVLPQMLMGYKVPAYSTSGRDSAAVVLTAEILLGKAGPLYKKMILDEQCMEKLEYWDWLQRDPGLFIVEGVLKEDKFDHVISSIDEEVGKLASGKLEKERLESARSHYKYNLLLSLDTARSVAQSLAFYATLDGDPMSLDKFLQRIDEVTLEDIARVASTVFVPKKRTIATLSYKKTAKEEGKP